MDKELIDYSYPLMMAERELKLTYDDLLANRHVDAMGRLSNTLKHVVDAMLMVRKEALDTQ